MRGIRDGLVQQESADRSVINVAQKRIFDKVYTCIYPRFEFESLF